MTRSGSKRNEKVWQVVRGCAGEGATEFQRVFRPLSSPRINHPWQRLSMSPPLLSSNSQLYGYPANQSSNENCNPFFFSFSFLPSTRKKKEISNDKITNSPLYLLCDSIFFNNACAFQVDWINDTSDTRAKRKNEIIFRTSEMQCYRARDVYFLESILSVIDDWFGKK